MPNYAANDYGFIRKRMRRNLVEAACHQAQLTTGSIPSDILVSAGFSPEEIAALGSQRNLPLNATDLLT